jgi:hypothetical protein
MGQGFLNWGLDRIRGFDELVDDVVVGPVVFKRTGIQQLIKEANRFRNADREVSNGVAAAILSIER